MDTVGTRITITSVSAGSELERLGARGIVVVPVATVVLELVLRVVLVLAPTLGEVVVGNG